MPRFLPMRCHLLAFISLTEERDDKCSKFIQIFCFRFIKKMCLDRFPLRKCTYYFAFAREHNLHPCDHVGTFSTAYFCVGWICAIAES